MALIKADRIQDVTTTTGTGPFTVSGTPAVGYRTFSSVCAVNDTFFGVIASQTLDEWNSGLFTYNASNQLTLTAPYEGSSGDNVAVSFSAGTKDVFLTKISKQWSELKHPGVVTGRYYMGMIPQTGSLNASALTANLIIGSLYWCPEKTTYTKIGCRVATGLSGNLQLAIYNVFGGLPTTKILSTSSQSTSAAGVKEVTISQVLDVGLYMNMVQADVAVSVNWVTELAGAAMFGWATDTGYENVFTSSQTFGTWPNNPAATWAANTNVPHIWLRK